MNNVSMAPCHHSQIQIKLTLGEFIILLNVRVKVSVHMINKRKFPSVVRWNCQIKSFALMESD